MISNLSTRINRFTSTKLWYYIENIFVVGLLFYCIKSLTDYDNAYYQTWKNAAAARAILAFSAIIFIIRKVKLLNWQSLVATLFFGAIFYERMHFWADAEDILEAVKPQMVAEWLNLMIIIDMILYKNLNNLFRKSNYLLILYIAMTIGMIWRRHDRLDPIVLIFPIFLFALIKMDGERTEWFMRRFFDGWFVAFLYVVVKSFKERPYEGFRYYGYFLNLGPFGIFMVCCFTTALVALFYIKSKYGYLNLFFLLGVVWLLSIIYMMWIINTRTIVSGVLLCLIFVFLFVRKNSNLKNVIKRLAFLLIILSLFAVSCIFIIKACTHVSDEWIYNNFVGRFSPLTYYIFKFKYIGVHSDGLSMSQKIKQALNVFSSGRISIISAYRDYFNYEGNGSVGLFVEDFDYWAYAVHNTYVQFLVEYGYISVVELLSTILISVIISAKSYIINGINGLNILTMLWLASMLGVWIGESNTFFYPITFFGFILISRLLTYEDI